MGVLFRHDVGGMPHHPLDNGFVNPYLAARCCEAMPKLVECAAYSVIFAPFSPIAGRFIASKDFSLFIREDVTILPIESFCDIRQEEYRPDPCVRLWLFYVRSSADIVYAFRNMDLVFIPVDILVSQSKCFSNTKPGHHNEVTKS